MAVVLTPVEEMTTLVCLGLQKEVQINSERALSNKSHGLLPPGGFSSLSFDQAVPYYSQRYLADRNAKYILHQ